MAADRPERFLMSDDRDGRTAACELCGMPGRELRALALQDFLGWACRACREQLRDSTPGKGRGTGEETEPGE